MSEEFQIRDAEFTEFERGGGRNELVILVVVRADAGLSTVKSIRGCVQGNVESIVRDEEGDTVTERYRLLPPPNVSPEVVVQRNWFPMPGSPSLSCQAPVEEEPA